MHKFQNLQKLPKLTVIVYCMMLRNIGKDTRHFVETSWSNTDLLGERSLIYLEVPNMLND